MSPTTRSDSMKKKLQNREAYSRSAKRSLENDFEATTSDAQTEINKVAKRAAKNTNKVGSLKSQKRKRFNVGINTPKITKKPKESEPVIVSDDDFQSNQFMQKKKKRSDIKIGIGRGKFPRETLAVKKNAVEDLEALAMHSLIFEPLYEYVGSAQLIIIPLRHSGKCHFTLLTLDTMVPCFLHYDSMNSRQSRPAECFKEAELMVYMINFWMRGVLFQAEEMLRTRERKKLNKRESTNSMLKLDMDYLTEKEILTIKWVQENFKSKLKLVDQKDVVPKQAYGSVDCGIYVMHYMDFLAKEKNLCCAFDANDAIRFRADIVNRFARSSRCWRAAE